MNDSGIYGIFAGEECCYVGQSVQLKIRHWQHENMLKLGVHFNPRLQRKYSRGDVFDYRLLESVDDRQKLTEREVHWIHELNPTCNIVQPRDELYMSSGRKGKPAWNSGKTKDQDDRIKLIGEKISASKQGHPNGTKGLGGSYRKGETKETNSACKKQSESLSARPLVVCEHCGGRFKVLKRHYNYCKELAKKDPSFHEEHLRRIGKVEEVI